MRRFQAFVHAACALLTTSILLAPCATAQNIARAKIPFEFTANQKVMPAGCYQVRLEQRSFLYLKNCDTGAPAILLARVIETYRSGRHSSMVFYNSGHRYRLTDVYFGFTNTQVVLAKQPKFERELAKNDRGETIEIAMR